MCRSIEAGVIVTGRGIYTQLMMLIFVLGDDRVKKSLFDDGVIIADAALALCEHPFSTRSVCVLTSPLLELRMAF